MRTPHPPLAMQLHSLVDLQMSSSINGRFINVVVHILNIAANLYIVDILPMHFWRISFGTNSASFRLKIVFTFCLYIFSM
jgi:hypothetical protein